MTQPRLDLSILFISLFLSCSYGNVLLSSLYYYSFPNIVFILSLCPRPPADTFPFDYSPSCFAATTMLYYTDLTNVSDEPEDKQKEDMAQERFSSHQCLLKHIQYVS